MLNYLSIFFEDPLDIKNTIGQGCETTLRYERTVVVNAMAGLAKMMTRLWSAPPVMLYLVLTNPFLSRGNLAIECFDKYGVGYNPTINGSTVEQKLIGLLSINEVYYDLHLCKVYIAMVGLNDVSCPVLDINFHIANNDKFVWTGSNLPTNTLSDFETMREIALPSRATDDQITFQDPDLLSRGEHSAMMTFMIHGHESGALKFGSMPI